ncbi:MAG: MBL fold metallo-hydrolase [Lachnospira sp.]|nr:MBL fold metallo-hydrolase [Lachnospira sp.]
MGQISVDVKVLGMVRTNCYLLNNDEINECVLIDAADNADELIRMVEAHGSKLKAVLLTHGHFDHILAAKEVCERCGVKLYASLQEQEVLESPVINLSENYGMNVSIKADETLSDGQILNLAGMDIKVLLTPGHTKGGVCYYVESENILFSGDTLFAESVGITDFPTGSMSMIVRSIKDKIMVLPDNTRVYPGHGEGTSVGYERINNPFL